MIRPTVGRVLWFYEWSQNAGHLGPLAAIVAAVHGDSCVSLMVIGPSGVPYSETSVRLVQEFEEAPLGNYCAWMPYQLGQAARTEAAEKALAAPK